MTIHEAVSRMKQNRGDLSGASVLNPEISSQDAWELLWRELVKLYGQHNPTTQLSAWLVKRVNQVLMNRINVELEDPPRTYPHLVMSPPTRSRIMRVNELAQHNHIQDPLPPPTLNEAANPPAPKKKIIKLKPFDRKFS